MSNIRPKIKQFLISGSFKTPTNYLKSKGVKIGTGCAIAPCHLSAKEGYLIEIGNYCRIAKDCEFFTHGGIFSLQILKNDPKLDYFGKIKIGNYVSIGEGSKIMAGVTIGDNVIIGAGSVVTKSVPAGYMVAGNPIKCIGYTEEWYNTLKEKYDLESGQMSDSEKKAFLKSLPNDRFVQKPNVKPKE
ncbi:MAG: acyltransferase [Bacteroidales bacterium]